MLRVFATFPSGGTFFSYIKRLSDGLFYDTDDETFKAFGSLVGGQIEFTEDSDVSGEYSWELELADGEYVIYTKQNPGATNAAQARAVTIKFGNEVASAQIIGAISEGTIEMEIECDG